MNCPRPRPHSQLNQGNRPRSSPSLPTEEEERAGERSRVFIGFPLSPTLSPLVPRGEREKTKRRLIPAPLSPILWTPLYVPARLKNPLAEVGLAILVLFAIL